MIDVHYRGRLGNNLFQYCLGRILAEELGFKLKAGANPGFPNTAQEVPGACHTEPEQVLTGQRIDFGSILADRSPRRLVLHGYFQQIEYYQPYRDRIRHWLALDPAIRIPAMKPDLVIHVRRKDYVAYGWALPFSYYEEAIQRVLPPGGNIWIATDDHRDPFFWRFKHWKPNFFHGTALENIAFLMNAPRLVLSPSSFSWWAAFLGDCQEVVAPVSGYGLWSCDPESANLIDHDRFMCIECPEPYQPTGAEKIYHQGRSLRLRFVQKLNRDLNFSLPEQY